MSYFGGSVSARPWPKVDARFALIFLCSFGGLAVCLVLARDLPILREAGAASSLKASERTAAPTTVPVLVAAAEIPAGTWLTPSMFRFEQRSIRGLEGQMVQNLDEITGTVTRTAIAAHTPLLKAAFAKRDASSEITDRIPMGFRAVAIPINALTGVEGWVQPGATVDVVWSIEKDRQLSVATIVENARVLSVERSLEPKDKSELLPTSQPRHITLLVSTEDAQKIQLAKGAGSLNLSLRNGNDTNTLGDSTLTTESLFVQSKPRPAITGRVRVDGKEYVLRGSSLLPADEDESSEAA